MAGLDFNATPLTIILLILNIAASVYALRYDRGLIERCSLNVGRVLDHREDDRILLSGFFHADGGHLLFNMLTLFFFGPEMERTLGTLHFLVLYFGSELAASLLTLYVQRKNKAYSSIGASGAISGVITAFCILYPTSKIYLFFIPIGIPAIIYAPAYIAYSMYAMSNKGFGGRVAHEAHLGGAIAGVVLLLLLYPDAIHTFFSHFR